MTYDKEFKLLRQKSQTVSKVQTPPNRAWFKKLRLKLAEGHHVEYNISTENEKVAQEIPKVPFCLRNQSKKDLWALNDRHFHLA